MKKHLTFAAMLQITSMYPKNLSKKEDDILTKASKMVEQIKTDLGAIKVKGEDNERNLERASKDLEEVKKLAKEASKTHEAHDEDMKALKNKCDAMEKSLGEVDLRIQKGGFQNAGLVNYDGFKKLHKEKMAEFEKCASTGGASALTLKMSVGEYNTYFNKAYSQKASNMTESANFSGQFVIAPDRLPGFFAPPLRPVHIREFINQSPTDSNLINYTQETAFTDGSASTAQGAAATQSDFTLTAQQMIVQKINTYFTVAKEMLADTPVTENYIRTRGVGRLMMFEDTALLYGNGTPPNQNGMTLVASAYANGVIPGRTPTNPPNYYDILFAAVTQATVAYYVPNIIILNPVDFEAIALTQSSGSGVYQFPQMITGNPGEFYINGARVVKNTAINQGYFFVGDMEQAATLFFRDEIEITFSNQHVDNFIKGYITVMVEERLGLATYRPTALIYGNFNQAIISGS